MSYTKRDDSKSFPRDHDCGAFLVLDSQGHTLKCREDGTMGGYDHASFHCSKCGHSWTLTKG